MTNRAASSPTRLHLTAVGFVFGGLLFQQVGASIAVIFFPVVGPVGMASLRLIFSAAILLLICRPRLRGYSRNDWATVAGFGLVLAGMNVLFYEAIARIPLGAAVTIEILGPLVLSVMLSRRASSWLWAILALSGVALLGLDSFGSLDLAGVAFALAAGACWAGYIVLSSRTGGRFPKLDGLAIAMTIGGLATLPAGIVMTGPALFSPTILLLGLAVAALSSTLPYGLEISALRTLSAATFAILLSLAPAVAAIIGMLLLGQELTLVQAGAIGLVVIASIGAVRLSTPRPVGYPAT
jgi:inner membrane transporter RhtA